MKDITRYIVEELEQSKIRHEIHYFPSGAKMIDVWLKDEFYCIQLEEKIIGISLVVKDIDFSTIPDKSYQDIDRFKIDFEKILDKYRQQSITL